MSEQTQTVDATNLRSVLSAYHVVDFIHAKTTLPQVKGVVVVFNNMNTCLLVTKTSSLRKYFTRGKRLKELSTYKAARVYYFPSDDDAFLKEEVGKLTNLFSPKTHAGGGVVKKKRSAHDFSMVAGINYVNTYIALKAFTNALIDRTHKMHDQVVLTLFNMGGMFEGSTHCVQLRSIVEYSYSEQVQELEKRIQETTQKLQQLKEEERKAGIATRVSEKLVPVITSKEISVANRDAHSLLLQKATNALSIFLRN